MIVGSPAGGAIVFVVKSGADERLIDAVFDSLAVAAKLQVTSNRPALILAELHGLNADELYTIGTEQSDPSRKPSLRRRASEFLQESSRQHVVGVGFLSRSDILATNNEMVESGGSTYVVSNPESTFWHKDFGGLFSMA
jgi:hypothetical protein